MSSINQNNGTADVMNGTIDETVEAGIVLEPFVLDVLNGIAKDEGFTDYTVKSSSGSKHGDNFMGIMMRVLIKGCRNGRPTVLSLMLKMPPLSKARRKQFKSALLFEREVYMYRSVLPAFAEFQREKGLQPENGFFAFPRCFGIVADSENDNYAIILEDLKEQGYDMFNKKKSIDLEHVRLIMEELGRYHAVSFAMRDQRPEVFEPFKKMQDVFLEMMRGSREMMQSFQDKAFNRAKDALGEDEVELREKIENLHSRFEETMEECVSFHTAEPFCVINHGDCWNNNMMYLYRYGVSFYSYIKVSVFYKQKLSTNYFSRQYHSASASLTSRLHDVHLLCSILSIFCSLQQKKRYVMLILMRFYIFTIMPLVQRFVKWAAIPSAYSVTRILWVNLRNLVVMVCLSHQCSCR